MIINKDYEYLHFALYQYYLGYLEEFNQEHLPEEHFLHFEFEDETYSIRISLLKERAFDEMDAFLDKYRDENIQQKINELKDEVAEKLKK